MRCAELLLSAGFSVLVVEAESSPGGRLRTDTFEGYLLDRGFQVLQTAYPETRRVLDYGALDLRPFRPGALVRLADGFTRIGDPFRRPRDLFPTALSPVGTLADKLRVLALRRQLLGSSLEAIYARPEQTGIDWLRAKGFSERFIEQFFMPFLAGVFFDPELGVSSRSVEFVMWAFAAAETALPAGGMGQISAQLAGRLPAQALRFEARVEKIREGAITLTGGEEIRCRTIVLATELSETERLLGLDTRTPSRATACVYFTAPESPVGEPILALNGTGRGIVNSLTVPSELSERYAPAGMHLIGVNVLGATELDDTETVAAVRQELGEWFGTQVGEWRHLKSYYLPRALPPQQPPVPYPPDRRCKVEDWLYVCGEYAASPSFQWALSAAASTAAEIAGAAAVTQAPVA